MFKVFIHHEGHEVFTLVFLLVLRGDGFYDLVVIQIRNGSASRDRLVVNKFIVSSASILVYMYLT